MLPWDGKSSVLENVGGKDFFSFGSSEITSGAFLLLGGWERINGLYLTRRHLSYLVY